MNLLRELNPHRDFPLPFLRLNQIASTRTLEYGQVCMASNNVFHRCKELSRIAHANLTNPMDQLEVVGNYVADLGHIIKVFNQKQRD